MIIFRGRTHFIIAWSLRDVFDFIPIPESILLIFLILGSMFPDVDTPYSKSGKIFPLWILFKHRGVTHTLLSAIILSIPIIYINKYYALSFFIGYILHLITDTFTPTGVKWFYPFKDKSYTFKLIKTGSIEENLIFLMLLGLILQ